MFEEKHFSRKHFEEAFLRKHLRQIAGKHFKEAFERNTLKETILRKIEGNILRNNF